MQIHGPTEVVQGIEVTRLSASGSVALSFTGGASLVMQSGTDFDDLIRAAVAGKTLFLGKDDLSAAIVADLDAQLTPPAERGRDTNRTPPGHQLPAASLPTCPVRWSNGAGHGGCIGADGHEGPHQDVTGHRWVFAGAAFAKADAR